MQKCKYSIMSENKLPADPLSMIIGIGAILFSIAGCCSSIILFPFALIATLPLILSIIGIIVANKSLRLYRENSEVYQERSKNNVVTAKIVNILGLSFSILTLLYLLYTFFTMGTAFYDIVNQEDPINAIYTDYEEEPLDSIYFYTDELEVIDSTSVDSIY